ncbi:MAG: acetoin utilization protein AcuC [Actinomycetota bacterium]
MGDRVRLVDYGDAPEYDLGPSHPLRPDRFRLTMRLIEEYGIVDGQQVVKVAAEDATDELIGLVHDPGYLRAVRDAGHGKRGSYWEFGFGPGDNPIFPNMHEAAARVAGASLVAAQAIWSGEADHAFNPSGGLHHALPGRASGFCVYDDPAIAIAWLLEQGVERVAYVDVDAHHGDGPQAIFYHEPRVLTISLHQDGRTLFPGTGFVDESGAGKAVGMSVNVPLPPFTSDDLWLHAFREVVPPLLHAWEPQVLVTQLGCDTHHTDPLTNLSLTTDAFFRTARLLHDLAHSSAGGKWLATGGGGYQWARVVPRAWTIYFAEMAGVTLADDLPAAWLSHAEQVAGHSLPETLSEPPVASEVELSAVDRVIEQVRETIFPYHRL